MENLGWGYVLKWELGGRCIIPCFSSELLFGFICTLSIEWMGMVRGSN